jgi:hypothetical protein
VLWPAAAAGTTLAPGDVVVSSLGFSGPPAGLVRVDPVTHGYELIAAGDFADFSPHGTGTIYAVQGNAVVAVDVASGSQHVVSSGGMLVAPSGIAVHDGGRLFVSDYEALGGDGAIFEIDPSSGTQSVLTSGGFLASDGFTDLEMLPGGDLILLDRHPDEPAFQADVWRIDWNTGAGTLLYEDADDLFTAGTTGLGVAPTGDIYVSNGFSMNTHVLKVDPITGNAIVVGSITIPAPYFIDLPGTDIAIRADGTGFMSANARGVFEWDGAPLHNDGIGFVDGAFNEVQIVLPEPASALLCALGLAWMSVRARRLRR